MNCKKGDIFRFLLFQKRHEVINSSNVFNKNLLVFCRVDAASNSIESMLLSKIF